MPSVSTEIEPIFRYVYSEVVATAAELEISFVVVGASARDLLMHHVYGAPIQRATNDIDFVLQVPSWESFNSLRAALLERGFSETETQHRLVSPDDVRIDIVPFGNISDANSFIEWPEGDAMRMNVLGFQEALDHSEPVRIQTDPVVDVPVATPAGMALLKLMAWTDRPPELRTKDATDLRYFLVNYDRIPGVLDAIYNDPAPGERYDWDATAMSAHLLGQHAAAIASPETKQAIRSLIIDDNSKKERLVWEMRAGVDEQLEGAQNLFDAFQFGFAGP